MVALPWELCVIVGALVVQFFYSQLYEHFTAASVSTSPRFNVEEYFSTVKDYFISVTAQATSSTPATDPAPPKATPPTKVEEDQDPVYEHLKGFPSEPQAAVEKWGAFYERHLACPTNSTSSSPSIWAARVRNYGEDPVGGDSFGVSITGAPLLAMGRELILHGGWDDRSGPRSAVFSIDINEVVRFGQLAPVQIPVAYAKGATERACPGPAYGHTVTALGGHEFLMLGGQRKGGYRGTLDQWGVFRLTRAAGASPWQLTWLRCGQSLEARRAWHTATFVPATHASQSYVFICGGSEAKVKAATFEPQSSRFTALSKEAGKFCNRAGHSALLDGDVVVVMGGTNYLGPGMPWDGEDLQHVLFFDTASQAWKHGRTVQDDDLGEGLHSLFDRQHSSTLVAPGLAVLLSGGLGGSDRAVLLNLTAAREGHAVDTEREWAQLLPTVALPASCPGDPLVKHSDMEVPSAHVPPLRGQSMVWTGQELVVFGGAVAEQPGYHGMLLLRPLWDLSIAASAEASSEISP